MLGGIGTWEILLIFLVILLMFGAKRIPEIARGIGKGVTEFKKGIRDIQDEIETGTDSPQTPPANKQAQTESVDPPASPEKPANS
jgi:sec-independent protein translocase protein TatA